MTMTLERALRVVSHAGYDGLSVEALDIVNEAGSRLHTLHQWNWTVRPPIHVGVRAPIDFDTATWAASKTVSGTAYPYVLTAVGAFASYSHANGDTVSIDAGTGVTQRDYVIREKISDDEISLEDAIISSGTPADVGGTINANRAVILPSDFGGRLTCYNTTAGMTYLLRLVGMQTLAETRTNTAQTPAGSYIGAAFTAPDMSVAGGQPTPRLEIWPYPSAVDADLFTLSYERGWQQVTTDSKIISIPVMIEPLFVAILRAVTRGYEEEEEGTVEDHMDRLQQSGLFLNLCVKDGLLQPNLGPLVGGGESVGGTYPWPLQTNYVSDPA